MEINICSLYPDLLNAYGDNGNSTLLQHRLKQRGITVNIINHKIGDVFSPRQYDIVLLGSGQDFELGIATDDIKRFASDLRSYVENDGVLLAISGGYQILGEYYTLADGTKTDGLGILPVRTEHSGSRFTGDIAIKICDTLCVGFENHLGKTDIGDLEPLGTVLKGHGNGCECGDGVRYKNTFCTYLHGPFLSKNPEIADIIISLALQKKYGEALLTPLDDEYELRAKRNILKKLSVI